MMRICMPKRSSQEVGLGEVAAVMGSIYSVFGTMR